MRCDERSDHFFAVCYDVAVNLNAWHVPSPSHIVITHTTKYYKIDDGTMTLPHLAQYDEDFARITGSGIHTFSDENKKKNRELQRKLLDVMPFKDLNKTNDCDLVYRFLIARHWNIELAEKSIREYLIWRRDENIDHVMWESVDPQIEETVAKFFGVDKERYPILWDAPNPKLVAQVLKTQSRESMLRAHYKMMESARYLTRSNHVDRITYVLDLSQVTMSSVNTDSLGILKEMSKKDQAYYPEVMRRMLICNGGWVVTAAWKVIRPLLDERVQKKIQFLKEAPSIKTLQEFIEAEHVKHSYGGCGQGLSPVTGVTLEEQFRCATSGEVGVVKGEKSDSAAVTLDDEARPQVTLTSTYDHEEEEDGANDADTSDEDDDGVRPEFLNKQNAATDEAAAHSPQTQPSQSRQATMEPIQDAEEYYSLSDDDDVGDPSPTKVGVVISALSLSQSKIGTAQPLKQEANLSDAVDTLLSPSGRKFSSQGCGLVPRSPNVAGPGASSPQQPLPASPKFVVKPAAAVLAPPAPVKAVITPGRHGDGTAVEIEVHQNGKAVRGFHNKRLIGESQDNLIVSTTDPTFTNSSMSLMNSPTRVLVGELLKESGHPLHTHLIVSDDKRTAKFILKQRNLHKQVVIFQVIGDDKIHTDKSYKHSVLGEKVKMARCGEWLEGNSKKQDWVVWGKVRVGTKEVRKYLAEKQGNSVLFYDTLASLPLQDLFCLCVGIMSLWDD